ncbi:hypothetical protein B0H63DRAFT_317164 [Podospora didyma]|uniref:Uncharacterized protein n=1 Tax=Podospora didyma TaxID=330526 RepID=A0AAE0K6C3_9PEZI|nr:hypothetical protein B0H63DRAFT_317164 [Podospora didyma]
MACHGYRPHAPYRLQVVKATRHVSRNLLPLVKQFWIYKRLERASGHGISFKSLVIFSSASAIFAFATLYAFVALYTHDMYKAMAMVMPDLRREKVKPSLFNSTNTDRQYLRYRLPGDWCLGRCGHSAGPYYPRSRNRSTSRSGILICLGDEVGANDGLP